MKNDEKFCPICKMTCRGDACGLWCYGECGILTIAQKSENIAHELFYIRKERE